MATMDVDDKLNLGLRKITRKLSKLGLETGFGLGGEDGYGVYFENDVFGMHPYCWCESNNCQWCRGCTCPDEAFTYKIDEKEVSIDFYFDFKGDGKFEILKNIDLICDFCNGSQLPSPNFWHKKSNTRVWWYKYIGRSMEHEIIGDVNKIIDECLESINDFTTFSISPDYELYLQKSNS